MNSKAKSALFAAALSSVLAVSAVQASDSAKHEAESLDHAKVSLTEAVKKAEEAGNGQAISAEYEFKGGRPGHYEVKVLSNDGQKLTRYDLSPRTGKIIATSDEKVQKLLTRIKPESIRSAPTSLTHAITTAEERAGGKATVAEVDRDGDQVKYTVKVAKLDGSTEKVKINGADGKIASAE
jgi:uncharacterized membrane protein YkoI